jgi:uncharacterized SAM-binding protein YcdF (DUF218 family)
MEWKIVYTIAALLLPPGCLLALALGGALLAVRWPRLGRSLIALSLVALYVLSTPFASEGMLRALEPAPRDPLARKDGQAIVVLGGGSYFAAPEYGSDTVGVFTLPRLRYAAHLYRLSSVPILVSGGTPRGTASSEAEQMESVLKTDFRIPVRWLEKGSHNTLENARMTRSMLAAEGIQRIYLVTHAWHFARARLAFEHAGFTVIPAPTAFSTHYPVSFVDFLPSAGALGTSSWVFHEIIGIGWYHLRIFLGR